MTYVQRNAARAVVVEDAIGFKIFWHGPRSVESTNKHYASLDDAAQMAHGCGASAIEHNGIVQKLYEEKGN